MALEIVTIPSILFCNQNMNWDIDWRSQGAGINLEGVTQQVRANYPRWIGSPKVALKETELLTWRAIRAYTSGRALCYRIKMFDPVGYNPTASLVTNGVDWANNLPWANGLGWEYDPFVLAKGTVQAGAVQMQITIESGASAPVPGQIMSYDDWPFVVTWVKDDGSNNYTIGVQMPIRTLIPNGAKIKLRASGLFLAREENMGLPDYGLSMTSMPTLFFEEYLR